MSLLQVSDNNKNTSSSGSSSNSSISSSKSYTQMTSLPRSPVDEINLNKFLVLSKSSSSLGCSGQEDKAQANAADNSNEDAKSLAALKDSLLASDLNHTPSSSSSSAAAVAAATSLPHTHLLLNHQHPSQASTHIESMYSLKSNLFNVFS